MSHERFNEIEHIVHHGGFPKEYGVSPDTLTVLRPEIAMCAAICFVLFLNIRSLNILSQGARAKAYPVAYETVIVLIPVFFVLLDAYSLPFGIFSHGELLGSNRFQTGMKMLIIITATIIIRYSEPYLTRDMRKQRSIELNMLSLLALLFMMLLVSAMDLFAASFAIVGFSLNLYVMIFTNAQTGVSREAGVKYFYLSTLSSGLLIGSIASVLHTLGTTGINDIRMIMDCKATSANIDFELLTLIIALAFKLSAFPAHL